MSRNRWENVVAKPYLSPAAFRFLAHRGLTVGSEQQPIDENTEPAFARALEAGATYLEVDVRASRDGLSVVCHDQDMVRVAGNPAKVAELDWQALSAIQLRHGGHLMSLDALLKRFPQARVNIDIKSSDAIVPTVRAIEQNRATDRVLISSFSERRRSAAVRLLPGVATSSSAQRLLAVWLAHKLGSQALLRRALRGLDAMQIPVSRGPLRFDSESFIGAVKRYGVELHYWTINEPKQALELRARGANGIVSDRIDLIVAALAE
jgi:glycerophosphoryl diester phosphodiesterase